MYLCILVDASWEISEPISLLTISHHGVTFTPHMAPLRESPWEAGPLSDSTGSTVIWGWKYVLLSTRSCAPWTFSVDLGGLDGWSPGGEQLERGFEEINLHIPIGNARGDRGWDVCFGRTSVDAPDESMAFKLAREDLLLCTRSWGNTASRYFMMDKNRWWKNHGKPP